MKGKGKKGEIEGKRQMEQREEKERNSEGSVEKETKGEEG